MGKGNGATRSTSASAPKGLTMAPSTEIRGGVVTINRALERARRMAFKVNDSRDEWELDTGRGMARIVKADEDGKGHYDIFLYHEDEVLETSYKRREDTLDKAKRAARNDLAFLISAANFDEYLFGN